MNKVYVFMRKEQDYDMLNHSVVIASCENEAVEIFLADAERFSISDTKDYEISVIGNSDLDSHLVFSDY